tara:strand:- start:382 stop:549 length:168 start_codon:yes stop_codon:yes gene_type:complete
MQELSLKLTREMKLNSDKRQKNIRRRLARVPLNGEASPSGQIVDADSSHYQGAGA